jgi:hypothetical protein
MEKQYTIKFEDIKPIGNFKEILEKLRSKVDIAVNEANEQKKYIPKLAGLIKFIVGEFALTSSLEEGLLKGDIWSEEECLLCLLYTHLLIIDLNSCAHKFLNKIEMDEPKKQLQDFIKNSDKSIYKNIQVI